MRTNYIYTIYDLALSGKSVRQIHQELYKLTINSRKVRPIKDVSSVKIVVVNDEKKEIDCSYVVLLAFSMKLATKVIKLANSYKNKDDSASEISKMLGKSKLFDNTESIINQESRKRESKDKQKYLYDMVKGKDIFFIASSHTDSAEDHKDYQGKLYVDRYWNQKTMNQKDIREFIKNNHLRTIQWVTGKPVYFVTRPNCRHYFKRVSIDEVLTGSFQVPHHEIGDRRYQTPRHKTLEYYERRLRMLKMLYERYKTEDLRIKILKTEIIIKKLKKTF